MRCVEVTEALSTSTGADSAALAAHLADCPRCAALARRDARFAQLWELTRPEDPPAAAWATVWGDVTLALDATSEPTLRLSPSASAPRVRPSAPSRPWRRGAWAAFAIAQAAVLLVGAWLVTRPHPGLGPLPPSGPALARQQPPTVVPGPPPPVVTPDAEIQIDDGDLVLIQSGSDGVLGVKVVSNIMDEGSRAEVMLGVGPVDSLLVALGIFEALAE